MSAVLNSVQPPGIIWPLAVQVRSGLVLGCGCQICLIPVKSLLVEDKIIDAKCLSWCTKKLVFLSL